MGISHRGQPQPSVTRVCSPRFVMVRAVAKTRRCAASYTRIVRERNVTFRAPGYARHRTSVLPAAPVLCEHYGDCGIDAMSSILPERMLEAAVNKWRKLRRLFRHPIDSR